MISTEELVFRTKKFMVDYPPDADILKVLDDILAFYHAHNILTPIQHTFLVSFCISHETSQEEYRRSQQYQKQQQARQAQRNIRK